MIGAAKIKSSRDLITSSRPFHGRFVIRNLYLLPPTHLLNFKSVSTRYEGMKNED